MKKYSWNERVDVQKAKEWITKLAAADEVEGPVEIYRSNDWGITALFHIKREAGFEEVVFKAAFLPIFQTSPAIYELLSHLQSDTLPDYLGGEVIGEETWLLFEKFSGKLVREEADLPSLIKTAETMAVIQKNTAEYINQYPSIPHYNFENLPGLLEKFIQESMENYLASWKGKQKEMADQYGLREEDLSAIADKDSMKWVLKSVEDILGLLQSVKIPYSIDHLDLHSNNAVRTEDGNILIFDFEEAVISCPLFSLEKLLDEAEKYETDYSAGVYKIKWNSAQLKLRDSYYEKLDTKLSHEQFIKLFDRVMAIAPLKYALQSLSFIREVGWEHMEPALMAESCIKAHQRLVELSE